MSVQPVSECWKFTAHICNGQLTSEHWRSLEVTAHICNVSPASEWTLEDSGGSLLTSLMSV
ncbi:hypothetical protein ACRRTK_020380 [Alexandromys fortis]